MDQKYVYIKCSIEWIRTEKNVRMIRWIFDKIFDFEILNLRLINNLLLYARKLIQNNNFFVLKQRISSIIY